MKNTAMEQRLNDEVRGFIDTRRSLHLASQCDDGYPYSSYAPFARDDQYLYVLLSDVAVHGGNLAREARASVLIVEDEGTSNELYARIRVGYQVQAEELDVGSPRWEHGVQCLEARHGERPRKLSALSDFRLFCLTPVTGRYVKGFGKAYTLTGDSLAGAVIDHLREGHRPREKQEEAAA
jgi:putative heme iron utilization protein